jgi:pimeloyl-ACP methyl ester carboxylesterase
VTGEGTSPSLRAVHETLARSLPNAHTLELEGGHAPHIVAMDTFLTRLREFQEGDPSSRSRHTARSKDGTPIAYWRSGSGPALLLVHGATADHTTTWRFVQSDLERHFTVYAMDRRGRGESGDAPAYALEREAEDVAAILEAIGEPVSVLGHSYGALVALEAARLAPRPHRLILYEGVPLRGSEAYKPGMIERFRTMLEAGDVEGMLSALFLELVEMPPEELELVRAQRDAWAVRLRNALTLPREMEVEESYIFRPGRFREDEHAYAPPGGRRQRRPRAPQGERRSRGAAGEPGGDHGGAAAHGDVLGPRPVREGGSELPALEGVTGTDRTLPPALTPRTAVAVRSWLWRPEASSPRSKVWRRWEPHRLGVPLGERTGR